MRTSTEMITQSTSEEHYHHKLQGNIATFEVYCSHNSGLGLFFELTCYFTYKEIYRWKDFRLLSKTDLFALEIFRFNS